MSRKLLLLAVVVIFTTFSFASVNVTIKANTSLIQGISDTLGYVDVRGNLNVGDPTSYQEGDWSGEVDFCTNLGGDYWERTYTFDDTYIGGTVEFKFGVGVVDYLTGDTTSYWENDAPGGEYLDNRSFVIPAQDTILPIAFVGHPAGTSPFSDDTKNEVYFRVNMGALNGFDPASDRVYIVGAFPGPDGTDNMWDPAKYELTREGTSLYYNYMLPLATTYEGTMYRYTLGSWDMSENVRGHGMFPDNENRGTVVNGDTTIAWKWWNDAPPSLVSGDTVTVIIRTDLTNAIGNNGFSIGDEDSLCVRVGYFNTAQYLEVGMEKVGLGGFVYQATIDSLIIGGLGEGVYYQYYKIPGTSSGEVRETYFNFDYEGGNASEAERRWVIIESDDQTINDNIDSQTDARRMPVFRNTNSVSQKVDVTFTLDLRPAYVHVANGITLTDIQGNVTVTTVEQINTLGVYLNGPASGGWTGWGTDLSNATEKKMWDDGTHGDAVAGDTIYTVMFTYGPDSSNNTIGQEFKFGIGAGDNESGYGLNHIENIDDSQSAATIHSQWGSINPVFYSMWNYDAQAPVGIVAGNNGLVKEYALNQNYPNPFNPTTEISFSIPKTGNVTLTIYNMLGQVVTKSVYSNMSVGNYSYLWDSRDMNGNTVSSGVYFYELKADNQFRDIKKMVLMK